MIDPHLPCEARILERVDESPAVFTLKLRLTDPAARAGYRFAPGQFNMLYLYGVGEVPISIVSDPEHEDVLEHTIRRVGRITAGLAAVQSGESLGLRGPYGRGWPLAELVGEDLLIITGGLGCAPSVSIINYVIRRRADYGRLIIMQGVKHYADLLWRARYERWAQAPNTQVLLAADVGGPVWPWHVGPVTELFDQAELDPARTAVLMCGPEGMMRVVVKTLCARGLREDRMWLSMERNMQCAIKQCGHCQFGAPFVCRDGPVFCYPEVKALMGVKGF